VTFDTTTKTIYVGGVRYSTTGTLNQIIGYSTHTANYTSGSFGYFTTSDFINSISDVDNSYSLVDFSHSATTITGTTINVPINFPTISSNQTKGGENIHYIMLKNTSLSDLTITIDPQPSYTMHITGDLSSFVLPSNKCVEISVKVLKDNWVILKSDILPLIEKTVQ
jgi:hypothetical protein